MHSVDRIVRGCAVYFIRFRYVGIGQSAFRVFRYRGEGYLYSLERRHRGVAGCSRMVRRLYRHLAASARVLLRALSKAVSPNFKLMF